MTRPRKRSRKRSAANSTAKRLGSAVFYLDESIYWRVLAEALEKAGGQIRRPGVDVPFGTADTEWLRLAGAQGWIVLMRDQRVRHRPLELESLRSARVAAFVLTAGQASAQQRGRSILTQIRGPPPRITAKLDLGYRISGDADTALSLPQRGGWRFGPS